jgi:hypothetical protein
MLLKSSDARHLQFSEIAVLFKFVCRFCVQDDMLYFRRSILLELLRMRVEGHSMIESAVVDVRRDGV